MNLWQSILFGLVEGLTEFVPVSSTAHMLLVQRLFAIPATDAVFSFLVLVQLGAIASLIVFFWKDLWALLRALLARPFSSELNRLAWYIVIATVPALLAGVILRDAVQALFADPLLEAAIRFLTAAALMGLAERFGRRSKDLTSMNWIDALVVGLFQILAVFPGASRSGAAISGGMLRNLERAPSTRFAFLMSAPVMVAAGAYEAVGAVQSGDLTALLPMLVLGAVVAGVVGWLSIRWLIGYVSRHSLYAFAAYCAALGLVCLILRAV